MTTKTPAEVAALSDEACNRMIAELEGYKFELRRSGRLNKVTFPNGCETDRHNSIEAAIACLNLDFSTSADATLAVLREREWAFRLSQALTLQDPTPYRAEIGIYVSYAPTPERALANALALALQAGKEAAGE